MLTENKSCLSYWFPKLEVEGIPVPKTEIITTDIDLDQLLENTVPEGFSQFVSAIQAAGDRLGYPCFLRTGHTSGKHDWLRTCYLDHPCSNVIGQHIVDLVEFSVCVDFFGLPTRVWAVRELLKTEPAFHAFHGLPITKERRYFIRDGKVEHHQPYWPPGAIAGHTEEPLWQELLAELNDETPETLTALTHLSEQVAAVMDGYWSVDWL
ncbi:MULTISPECIES: hypothetical protein [Trichocoleus]|uniref:Uncharacterized protein n=1 Tax=Trichocoleus desertorum GB2-A4 TaxID=2933944 RepID=A0ABV0JCI3_9CYAN|nr:hypothetical protein [Trichocoleus sp. FACHB-46]MBD1864154.1 hypothetical protein [Trichocoleus sp. FACHB-46]